ncbi:fasciculation and elongation protein zeta-2-like [Mytilus californianus]|uniref:fasciculation and elongation protein zeta-2-like n=1 Tax=Mytilus californianus TaxID=6549 RepID=UPI0022481060|nr:fasciculation and elongation protein zeta-2-like [Mytilus californianus]
MRGMKMAELHFEAPLAKFENEELAEYSDFQGVSETSSLLNTDMSSAHEKSEHSENFAETVSESLEDLVNTFDEKITKCFCNFEEKVDHIAPVQVRTQEEVVKDCQMWWTLTGNYGNILPIDWSKSYVKQMKEKVLHLEEGKASEPMNLDLSDDDDVAQALDMHSLIVSSLQHPETEDYVATAEEVISEIESMMQDGPLNGDETVDPTTLNVVPVEPDRDPVPVLPSYTESELKEMSCSALNEVLAEYEIVIKELSEILIRELALRDELEYDKELKNQFISLLLTIQKKRRDNNVDKKKKKTKTTSVNNNPDNPVSTFLTTVIPYHSFGGPPTSEQLQIYIKILKAINADSPTVPTLLTDYILKVLCPT